MSDDIAYYENRISELESLILYADPEEDAKFIGQWQTQIHGLQIQLQQLIAEKIFKEKYEDEE